MFQIPSKINLVELAEDTKNYKYNKDTTGVLIAFGQSKPISGITEILSNAVSEIVKLRNAKALHIMVNILPVGLRIPEHVDYIPDKRTVERWHLPIITTSDAGYWDEINGNLKMPSSFWHGTVPYWKRHSVWNYGKSDRIHLIVDLDTENLGDYE